MNMVQQLLIQYDLKAELALPGSLLDFSWAKELTFQIYIHSIGGSPVSASLDYRWEWTMPGSHPAWNEADMLSMPFEEQQINTLIKDGSNFPSPLVTETTPLPKGFQRTIVGFGYNARLILVPTFVGGTDPSFKVSAALIAKS